ncbi:rhomboid family membrane protein [Ophiocordyceps sinensis CO18]|uniref:Rhomboid family membrane protein n=1 Tax=Ophiocordyceps sinensis (strain Co18 / CGMCC 3.14243) TaxID=911162 RepID=T5A0H3_OPHSC|nr:rhomboid family membrane protein [Ophiocordyceps sinensis CO18]
MAQEQPPPPTLPPRIPFIHNAAVAGAIIAPLAMLLPPRKMDIRFFVLAGAFSLATNQLAYEYTGQSIYSRFGSRVGSVFDTGLPEGARRTQQLLKEQREREAAEKRSQAEAEAEKKRGLIKDIWMGSEGEDWSRKRAEEHQKSFQEGKGMSDIIMEQIMDVWSGRNRGPEKNRNDDRASRGDQGSDKK